MKKKIRVGIPRALFYYRYSTLYRKFFSYLGCDVVISGPTNDEVIKLGRTFVADGCLAVSCMVGHTFNLVNKCDYIFLPNYVNYGKEKMVCSLIGNVNDFLRKIFINVKFLNLDVDYSKGKYDFWGFFKVGMKLRKNIFRVIYACVKSKNKERCANDNLINSQNKLLLSNNKKILIVGYGYLVLDEYFTYKVTNYIKEKGIDLLYGSYVDRKISSSYYKDITCYLSNLYDKEIMGSISYLKEVTDGIIMFGSTDCKVNMALDSIKLEGYDKPILKLRYPYDMNEVIRFIVRIEKGNC